jgi:CHAD domain-containing protein
MRRVKPTSARAGAQPPRNRAARARRGRAPFDPVRVLACRLLRPPFRTVLRNERGVRLGRVKPLHDLRVAVRRLRALLRAFEGVFPPSSAARVEEELGRLSERLGPARDMDVWLTLLRREAPAFSGDPSWPRFFRQQQRSWEQAKRAMREALRSAGYRRLKADLERLLAPAHGRPAGADRRARPLAARALRREMRRAERRHKRCTPDYGVLETHRLRIACRRARYYAEFFAALLGEPVAKLGRRLKAVQDALGDLHDLDVGLRHLSAARSRVARALAERLSVERSRRLSDFHAPWSRYRRFARGRRLCRRLDP